MPETYTIGEFAEKYRFRDRREVLRYIALGVIRPMRRGGNSVFTENDAMKIAIYNTKKEERKQHD